MQANSTCLFCLLKKEEKALTKLSDESKKAQYMHEVLGVLHQYGLTQPAPWLTAQIQKIQQEYFGNLIDYTDIKHHFNQLLLSKEEVLYKKIHTAPDPLASCIRYVCAANYIDFAIPQGVTESTLDELMEKAEKESIDAEELLYFKNDISNANTMVYLTDNCGEIVLDKLFIQLMKKYNPNLQVTVIVRGKPVINDATMEDVKEVGLKEFAHCIPSGSDVAGTILEEISQEAREEVRAADLIISKGMGNFETLYGSGVNPYYFFLCKCSHFVERFGMDYYSTVFSKEERIQFA